MSHAAKTYILCQAISMSCVADTVALEEEAHVTCAQWKVCLCEDPFGQLLSAHRLHVSYKSILREVRRKHMSHVAPVATHLNIW